MTKSTYSTVSTTVIKKKATERERERGAKESPLNSRLNTMNGPSVKTELHSTKRSE